MIARSGSSATKIRSRRRATGSGRSGVTRRSAGSGQIRILVRRSRGRRSGLREPAERDDGVGPDQDAADAEQQRVAERRQAGADHRAGDPADGVGDAEEAEGPGTPWFLDRVGDRRPGGRDEGRVDAAQEEHEQRDVPHLGRQGHREHEDRGARDRADEHRAAADPVRQPAACDPRTDGEDRVGRDDEARLGGRRAERLDEVDRQEREEQAEAEARDEIAAGQDQHHARKLVEERAQ